MAKTKTNQHIEKLWNNLLNDVATNDFYKKDLTNRVNCYTCATCGYVTKTRDIDAGVTPAFIPCTRCNATASSSFYKDIAPFQEPTHEWYRPKLEYVLKLKNKPNLLDHFLNGGLDYRKIIIKEEKDASQK